MDDFDARKDPSLRRLLARLYAHSRSLQRMRDEQGELLRTVKADLEEARARSDDSSRTTWLGQIAAALEVAQNFQESVTVEPDEPGTLPPAPNVGLSISAGAAPEKH